MRKSAEQILDEFSTYMGHLVYELEVPKELTDVDVERFEPITNELAQQSYNELISIFNN